MLANAQLLKSADQSQHHDSHQSQNIHPKQSQHTDADQSQHSNVNQSQHVDLSQVIDADLRPNSTAESSSSGEEGDRHWSVSRGQHPNGSVNAAQEATVSGGGVQEPNESIDGAQGRNVSNSRGSPDVVVLDVRNDYEWDAGHFHGAERPQEVSIVPVDLCILHAS